MIALATVLQGREIYDRDIKTVEELGRQQTRKELTKRNTDTLEVEGEFSMMKTNILYVPKTNPPNLDLKGTEEVLIDTRGHMGKIFRPKGGEFSGQKVGIFPDPKGEDYTQPVLTFARNNNNVDANTGRVDTRKAGSPKQK